MAVAETILTVAQSNATALAIGLLIGLERGWQDRADPSGSRVAGFRTFGLIGLAGGLAATLDPGNGFVIAAAALGLSLLLREGFEARIGATQDFSATSMVAALITFSLGAIAVKLSPSLAAAGAVITAFLLWLREPMHQLLNRIEEGELSAFLRLLFISIVVLPVMPNEGMGPYGVVNPQQVWLMVVLLSGLGFLGYLGVKFVGARDGIGLLALAGGLASSTAATASFAHMSRSNDERAMVFASGTAVSWAIMFVRTAIIIAAIRPALLGPLWLPLAAMFGVTLAVGGVPLWRQQEKTAARLVLPNPLDLKSAMIFAAVLMAALVLSRLAEEALGQGGVFSVAAVAGAVDVDSMTLSMSKLSSGTLSDQIAARAILIAALANTLFKTALAAAAGTRNYARHVVLVAALAIMAGALATAVAVWAGWL